MIKQPLQNLQIVPRARSLAQNRDFFWNLFGNFAPLVVALLCTPYLYKVGNPTYVGYLTITWAAVGYTGLFDFGLSRAICFFAARSKRDSSVSLGYIILKSALLTTFLSIFVSAIFFLSSSSLFNWVEIKVVEHQMVISLLVYSLPIYLISNLLRSALEGLECFRDAAIVKFFSYSSLFLVPSALLNLGNKSLFDVCILYGAARLLVGIYAAIRLAAEIPKPTSSGGSSASFRKIVTFGGWATISSTISPLMVYGDRFVLAHFSGASSLALYAILQEFIGKTILFSASYIASFQPKMSYASMPEASEIYKKEQVNVIYFSLPIYLGSVLLAPIFVAFWLGVSASEVWFISAIMSVGFLFNSMAQAPYAFLMARGEPMRVAFAHCVEALLYAPLLIFATMHYGVSGAALAGLVRTIFDFGFLTWQTRRIID